MPYHFQIIKYVIIYIFHQIAYISMLCYNFGVEAFQNKCYEAAVNWLRDSYDVGKMNQTVSSQNQVQNLNDALQLVGHLDQVNDKLQYGYMTLYI